MESYTLERFNDTIEDHGIITLEKRLELLDKYLNIINVMVYKNKTDKKYLKILKSNKKEITDEIKKIQTDLEPVSQQIKPNQSIIDDLKTNGFELVKKEDYEYFINPLSTWGEGFEGIRKRLDITFIIISKKYYKISKKKTEKIYRVLINNLFVSEMARIFINMDLWDRINLKFQESDKTKESLYNILIIIYNDEINVGKKNISKSSKPIKINNYDKTNDSTKLFESEKQNKSIIESKPDDLAKLSEKQNKSTIESKPNKKKIPITLKRKVWDKWIGEDIGKSKCVCCKLTDITQLNFACGHIISENDGGELNVNNLKPICTSCNSSMGITNMDVFINKYGF